MASLAGGSAMHIACYSSAKYDPHSLIYSRSSSNTCDLSLVNHLPSL